MPNTKILKENGQEFYPVTHASLIVGMENQGRMDATYAWDGTGTPDITKIPAGVVVTYDGTSYTGTLAASADTAGRFYLVPSTTVTGEYDRYLTDATGSTITWKPAGTTAIPTPSILDNVTSTDTDKALSANQGKLLKDDLSQLEAKVAEADDTIVTEKVGSEYYYSEVEDNVTTVNGLAVTTDGNIIASTVAETKIIYCSVNRGDIIGVKVTNVWAANRLAFGFFDSVSVGSSSIDYRAIPANEVETKYYVTIAPKDCLFVVYSFNGFNIVRQKSKMLNMPEYQSDFEYPFSIIRGYGILYSTGEANIVTSGSRNCTDYINIQGLSSIIYTRHNTASSTNTFGLAFYDENKNYLSGKGGGVNADKSGYELREVTVPENAYYVRFTFWANPQRGKFWFAETGTDAVANELSAIDNELSEIDNEFSVIEERLNDLILYRIDSSFFHYSVAGTRAVFYMPYNGGCDVQVTQKEESNYQYGVTAVKVDSSHTLNSTILLEYSSGSNKCPISGDYTYIYVMFKTASGGTVSIEDILSSFDITVSYKKEILPLSGVNGEQRWDFYGAFVNSNDNTVITDYLAIPKQFMSLRLDIPEWMRVRFRYGLREFAGWTGYYYNGDVVNFTREQSALIAEFTRIDGRGLDNAVYDKNGAGQQMSLTILEMTGDDIIARNFEAEKYLGAIRTTPGESTNLPVIVHTSDIHGDSLRFNSVFDYADFLGARILVNTGDNPFFNSSQGVTFHEKVVKGHKTDFANCLGNHDTYDSSLSNIFNKMIAPFATDYEYHKTTTDDVTDKCYFFKDLADCNIRIIVLDIYEGFTYANYKARVSNTQISWFIDTLASTPAGYGVIVMMHQPPHTLSAISGKTDFNDSTMDAQQNAIDSNYMANGKIIGNPFGKIIDAFVSRATVSGSYTQKNEALTENETISYEADFTNIAEGVEFIAYLNGHTHRDYVGYVSDCVHRQLNLNVCAAPPISQSTGYKTASDIYRDSVGANQDAFNVYTINRTDKTVGIARIGSNLSKDLRPRKVMFVRYADDE